ncbi:MAG: hypothetical protein A2X94_02625 [Bdellovibrionales bacterium GWB1_55_8]|nr:MAG: hypothetical protein A2X94_02625 [Bdellovibrionales bacterium GWB1_55_8]
MKRVRTLSLWLAVGLLSFPETALSAPDLRLFASLAYSFPTYPGLLQAAVDKSSTEAGSSRMALSGKIGAYVPAIWSQTLWGLSSSTTVDSYSNDEISARISQYTLCTSILRSFAGRHLYGELNMGLALAHAANSSDRSTWSNPGASVGASLGYRYALFGSGKLVIAGLGHSLNYIEGESYRATTIHLGMLF